MRALNIDEITTAILQWIEHCVQSRPGFFAALFALQGGWETWVQADFAAFLNYIQRGQEPLDIQREVRIYAERNQAVDWLFNANTGYPSIGIEIKCQNAHMNAWQLLQGVNTDLIKIRQPLQIHNCTMYVIVFFIDQATQTAIRPRFNPPARPWLGYGSQLGFFVLPATTTIDLRVRQ
jgi:hypothetical protein